MRFKPAFTIIELLVVVALVAAIAVPSSMAIGSFRNRQAMATSVEELTGALRRAHIYAREAKDGQAWGVTFKDASSFVLVSGIPTDYSPRGEYALTAPSTFVNGGFEVWFGQGTGNVREEVSIEISQPSGLKAEVDVNKTGLVEAQ